MLPFVINHYAVTRWYTGDIPWWLGIIGMMLATSIHSIPLAMRAERGDSRAEWGESIIAGAINRLAVADDEGA